MEIKLKEKFLLLSLEDRKGGREKGVQFLEAGFIACILLEMILEEILEIKEGHLHLSRVRTSNDAVHRDVISQLLKQKKQKTIKFWITHLNMRSARYRKIVLKNLVYQRILRKEAHRFLFFRFYRYPTVNPDPENAFRRELVQTLKDPAHLNEMDLALLSILEAVKILSVLIPDKEEQKEARERIRRAAKDSDFGRAINKAIQEMTAAIVSTIVITGH